MYELRGLVNVWTSPAPGSGGVPVKPSYSWDPPAVLVRLTWQDGTALWVPGHANRWNESFVLVHVTPVEGDRRTESGLWVHHSDVTRALPTEPSTAPREPESRSVRDLREAHDRYPHGIAPLSARRREG